MRRKGTRRERARAAELRRTGEKGVAYNGKATQKQLDYLESLSRRAGYRFSSQAIKDCLGKNPINGLSKERASHVIEWLKGKVS